MNPLKPALDILYRFERIQGGVNIVPIHYFRWYVMCCIPAFVGIFLAYLLSFITDNTTYALVLVMPAFLVLLAGGYRIKTELKDTYFCQIIHSITIENGLIKGYVLPQQGAARWFLDMRSGPIEEPFEFLVDQIVDIGIDCVEFTWDSYYSLVATISTIDDEGNDAFMDLPISPRFRTEKDVREFHSRIQQYISSPGE